MPAAGIWTRRTRQMIRIGLPVALSAAVLQIGVLLDKGIAFVLAAEVGVEPSAVTPMTAGAAARLNWAQFLYQFPLGVFAIALATAVFPALAREAKADDGRNDAFRHTLRRGIESALYIGLPASAGLVLVATDATRVLFERGRFTAGDTTLVAMSVAIYSAAVWAFALQQIVNRAYYALQETRLPLIWAGWNLAINLAVELPLIWLLPRGYGEIGMPIGTFVSFAIQVVWMTRSLDRRLDGIGLGKSVKPLAVMMLATAAMVVVCLPVRLIEGQTHGRIARAAALDDGHRRRGVLRGDVVGRWLPVAATIGHVIRCDSHRATRLLQSHPLWPTTPASKLLPPPRPPTRRSVLAFAPGPGFAWFNRSPPVITRGAPSTTARSSRTSRSRPAPGTPTAAATSSGSTVWWSRRTTARCLRSIWTSTRTSRFSPIPPPRAEQADSLALERMASPTPRSYPPLLVALAGWAVPGLGHLLVRQTWRGIAIFSAVAMMFIGGLLIGGVRVVDMPGFVEGRRQVTRDGTWILVRQPLGAVMGRPWFVAQSLTGPTAFVAGYAGTVAARNGYPKPTARLSDIGVLYCAAAGMMNLIALSTPPVGPERTVRRDIPCSRDGFDGMGTVSVSRTALERLAGAVASPALGDRDRLQSR